MAKPLSPVFDKGAGQGVVGADGAFRLNRRHPGLQMAVAFRMSGQVVTMLSSCGIATSSPRASPAASQEELRAEAARRGSRNRRVGRR